MRLMTHALDVYVDDDYERKKRLCVDLMRKFKLVVFTQSFKKGYLRMLFGLWRIKQASTTEIRKNRDSRATWDSGDLCGSGSALP